MPFPSLSDLELELRTGSAIAVIVEGEEGTDAWVYSSWFRPRALEIRFFPQGSWQAVVDAVGHIRATLEGFPVFGLVDRDFTEDDRLDELVPSGVYRSRVYSVENHLLEPHCWHALFELVMARHGGLPAGWSSPEEVQARIEESYTGCLPAAVFNQIVARTCRAHPEYPGAPKYIRSLQDRRLAQARATLQQWGQRVNHSQSLGEEYARALGQLASKGPEARRCLVDGKMVINTLLGEFQKIRPGKSYEYGDYITHYLRECPDPPQEAVDLVERIFADARALTGGLAAP